MKSEGREGWCGDVQAFKWEGGGGALRYFLDLYSGWAAVRKLWGHKWTRG